MSKREIPVECYSRVVGYFRPVAQTNPGKKEEISQRKHFDANSFFKEVIENELD